MKSVKVLFWMTFLLWLPASVLTAQTVTEAQAAQLAAQYLPQAVIDKYTLAHHLEDLQNPLQAIKPGWGQEIHYLNFTMPNDPNQYLLLGWGDGSSTDALYWRLLKSADNGKSWMVQQDAPRWYGPLGYNNRWWLADLTGDGIPELCVDGAPLDKDGEALLVFAWRNGGFVCITPGTGFFNDDPAVTFFSAFCSTAVNIEDVDGDGKAEIVVSADLENEPDPNFNPDSPSYHTVALTPTQIYKYDGTSYVLWREIPWSDNAPYPINVPALAVVHPGTIPLSELQGGGGNGTLQIFVSHPAGTYTVEDMNSGSFTFQGTPLTFQKKWPNQKQPDTTSANFEWEGCPVKQEAPTARGEWNPPPEDPFLPAPDGKREYHFVAPYLELRLAQSAVYPYLLQAATDAFSRDPSRQTYFVSIPLAGKMTNGKLAAVSALVCIKNTGSNDKAKTVPAKAISPPPSTPAAPEKPKR
ncbi:MAG: VCBS repeat-containing protein [Acidobacteriota bacterium]